MSSYPEELIHALPWLFQTDHTCNAQGSTPCDVFYPISARSGDAPYVSSTQPLSNNHKSKILIVTLSLLRRAELLDWKYWLPWFRENDIKVCLVRSYKTSFESGSGHKEKNFILFDKSTPEKEEEYLLTELYQLTGEFDKNVDYKILCNETGFPRKDFAYPNEHQTSQLIGFFRTSFSNNLRENKLAQLVSHFSDKSLEVLMKTEGIDEIKNINDLSFTKMVLKKKAEKIKSKTDFNQFVRGWKKALNPITNSLYYKICTELFFLTIRDNKSLKEFLSEKELKRFNKIDSIHPGASKKTKKEFEKKLRIFMHIVMCNSYLALKEMNSTESESNTGLGYMLEALPVDSKRRHLRRAEKQKSYDELLRNQRKEKILKEIKQCIINCCGKAYNKEHEKKLGNYIRNFDDVLNIPDFINFLYAAKESQWVINKLIGELQRPAKISEELSVLSNAFNKIYLDPFLFSNMFKPFCKIVYEIKKRKIFQLFGYIDNSDLVRKIAECLEIKPDLENEEHFVIFLKHFVDGKNCSKDEKEKFFNRIKEKYGSIKSIKEINNFTMICENPVFCKMIKDNLSKFKFSGKMYPVGPLRILFNEMLDIYSSRVAKYQGAQEVIISLLPPEHVDKYSTFLKESLDKTIPDKKNRENFLRKWLRGTVNFSLENFRETTKFISYWQPDFFRFLDRHPELMNHPSVLLPLLNQELSKQVAGIFKYSTKKPEDNYNEFLIPNILKMKAREEMKTREEFPNKCLIYTASNVDDGNQLKIRHKKFSSTFLMSPVGEKLNYTKEPLMRTAVFSIEIGKNGVCFEKYIPQEVSKEVELSALTKDSINNLRSSDRCFYSLFTIKLPRKGEVPLHSVTPNDKIVGYVSLQEGGNLEGIKVRLKSDFRYYIRQEKESKEVIIKYVVESPSLTINQKKAPGFITKLRSSYKACKENFENKDGKIFKSEKDYEYLSKLGPREGMSCKLRAAAFCYVVKKHIIDNGLEKRYDVFVTQVNQNHMIVELIDKDNKQLWQYNLGGRSAKKIYLSEKGNRPSNTTRHHATRSIDVKNKPIKFPKKIKKSRANIIKMPDISWVNSSWNFEKELGNLIKTLSAQTKPKKIHSVDKLLFTVFSKSLTSTRGNHTLLLTNNHIQIISSLLAYAKRHKKPSCYIIKNDKDLITDGMVIDKGGNIKPNATGAFDDYIKKTEEPVIIILWMNFDDNKKIIWNKIFDDNPQLAGRNLPKNCRVISFVQSPPEDESFVTRHRSYFDCSKMSHLDLEIKSPKQKSKSQILDLRGRTNHWQEHLFGPVWMNKKGGYEWHKSAVVSSLIKRASQQYEIINIHPSIFDEVQETFLWAQAKGYIEFCGYKIYLKNKQFSFKGIDFNFEQFRYLPIQVYNEVIYTAIKGDIPIINTHRFELILNREIIENGFPIRVPGLCEYYAEKSLTLFVSNNLSESQWYELLCEAKKYKTRINLYIASGVKLPKNLERIFNVSKYDCEKSSESSKSNIIITNSSKAWIKNHGKLSKDTLIIPVEDYTWEDLLKKIDVNISSNKVAINLSPLIERLKQGKRVILHGEFSIKLLNCLYPLMLDPIAYCKELFGVRIKGEIIFVIEKTSSFTNHFQQKLIPYAEEHDFQSSKLTEKPILLQEIRQTEQKKSKEVQPQGFRQKTKRFLDNRVDKILNYGNQYGIVRLLGPPEAGKSSIINELNKRGNVKVFFGLEQLKAFCEHAKKNTTDKVVLFIDEVNLLNTKHLTSLAPFLKKEHMNADKKMLRNHELLPIYNNQFIVVAMNSNQLRGGRVHQKLFDSDVLPTIQYEKLPDYYVYHLLFSVYQRFPHSPLFSQGYFENLWRDIRQETVSGNPTSVREQQHKLISHFSRPLLGGEKKRGGGYIPLPFQKKIMGRIQSFLGDNITSQMVINSSGVEKNSISGFSPGKKAFYLQGPSGIGKTSLIIYTLKCAGYQLWSESKQFNPEKKNDSFLYVLDPSFSFLEMKNVLKNIEKNGGVLLLDEFNAYSDNGILSLINPLLTNNSKVIVFFTGNPSWLNHRANLDHSFKTRIEFFEMGLPARKDLEVLLKHFCQQSKFKLLQDLGSDIKPTFNLMISKLAKRLVNLMKEVKCFNLRQIIYNRETIVEVIVNSLQYRSYIKLLGKECFFTASFEKLSVKEEKPYPNEMGDLTPGTAKPSVKR